MKQIFGKSLVKKILAILLIFFLIQYLTYLCIINNNKEIQEPFRMYINFDVLNEKVNEVPYGSANEFSGNTVLNVIKKNNESVNIGELEDKADTVLNFGFERETYNNLNSGNFTSEEEDNILHEEDDYYNPIIDQGDENMELDDDQLDEKCKKQYGDGENGKKYSQFVRISHDTEPNSHGACNRYFSSISDFNIEDDEGFSDNTTKDFYKAYSKGGGLCCTISKDKITDLCKKKYNKFDKHAAVKVKLKAGSCSSKGHPDALDFKSPLEDWSCCAS